MAVPDNKHVDDRQPSHDLGRSIVESLCPGIVAYDRSLKIILANAQADALIELGEHFDTSLAKGTDSNIWGNWNSLLKDSIASDKESEFDLVRYLRKGSHRLLSIVCSPLKDSGTNKTIGGTAMITDVTERINIEHQLAQAERLASVGKVAGKVAHELNNPIDGILRYLNLAVRVIDGNDIPKAKEYLVHCRRGLMRMVAIISELLEFSRFAHISFEPVALDKIIEEAIKAMHLAVKDLTVNVIDDYTGQTPWVKGGNLFQVFCNLIKNASDASGRTGTLDITIGKDDANATIAFKDNGHGFGPEHADKIFEPFFTTKGTGKGTGLGLAICKDIIKKYDGTITAENVPDGGSVFTVTLPMAVID